jgi:hypothetical protein
VYLQQSSAMVCQRKGCQPSRVNLQAGASRRTTKPRPQQSRPQQSRPQQPRPQRFSLVSDKVIQLQKVTVLMCLHGARQWKRYHHRAQRAVLSRLRKSRGGRLHDASVHSDSTSDGGSRKTDELTWVVEWHCVRYRGFDLGVRGERLGETPSM